MPAEHDGAVLSPEDRAEIERMVEEGVEDYDNGVCENARALGQRLLARSCEPYLEPVAIIESSSDGAR